MRKKLIELLKSDMNVLKAAGTSATATLRLADNLIANGVTLDNQVSSSKWIPVTERLPKEFASVLVCIPSENPLPMVKEAYLANGCWATKMAIFPFEDITHWMEMPEPPKGE